MKTTSVVENARAIFGAHPEDVISPIKSTAEALGWLEEIFNTIKNEEIDRPNSGRIRRLAELGAYVALDIGNHANCEHEERLDCLRKAGVIGSVEVAK